MLVGISRRLPNKHLLKVWNNKRLIDIVIENLKRLNLDVIVYSKIMLDVDAPVIMDNNEWILKSIVSILRRDSGVFIFGGDMPTVSAEAVELLISRYRGRTIIPRWRKSGFLEPLHGIYCDSVIPCLEGARSITAGLKNCQSVDFVDAELFPAQTFFNVNTLKDMLMLKNMQIEL